MEMRVLGMGCPRCKTLYDNAESAISRLGLQADLLKVTDLNEIASYGVMSTPALALGDEVLVSGRVPGVDEIAELLSEHLKRSG
ncbi:thioredoxin family protein [Candidatus Fermentibacteria bacterium]|nr:thioredoxin family protein [Candidatus Fermentibacteria bacterium]